MGKTLLPGLPHAHLHTPSSSCTHRWRTSSVWQLGSCASWPRTRRPLTPSMLRGPRPHSWSSCTLTMRAQVRGWVKGQCVQERGQALFPQPSGGSSTDLALPYPSTQPHTLLRSCSVYLRIRTQTTGSACLWSSPTPFSSMTQLPGRL